MFGFIYIKWDTGAITRESVKVAEAFAESPFLAHRIVDTAWCITELA